MPSFDVNYPDNPWEGIVTNQRKKYDPMLRAFWNKRKVFSNFALPVFDTQGTPNTDSIEVTSVILPNVNIAPISARQLWIDSSRFDSAARTLSTRRFGSKVSYHVEDPMITYWESQGGGANAIQKLVNEGLGHMMMEMAELRVRNTYLSNTFKLFGDGSGTDFSHIDSINKRLTTSVLREIQLGMQIRGAPFAQGEGPAALICVTTPSVYFDLSGEISATGNENAFVDVMKYRDAQRIFNGEIGSYHGVRMIVTPYAYLYNCGPIVRQTTISAAANAGDGVNPASKVDDVWKVGQTSGITNYVQLLAVGTQGAEDAIKADDILTFHLTRGSTYGVPNGVLYTEGTLFNVRVVSVDYGNNRVVLERPLPWDFATDLGAGVYGYATKGRHLSTSTFIGAINGVVHAVKQPPRLYAPPAVDDFESVRRFSFDVRDDYHLWEPSFFEVHVGAGTFRTKGPAIR
jgi:hypothetical protein